MNPGPVWFPTARVGLDDTETEAAFRVRARNWLREHAQPRGRHTQWAVRDPEQLVGVGRQFQSKLHEAGFAGISVPVKYGGLGLSLREQLIWSEETADYDLPVTLLMLALNLCAPTLLALGSEDLKLRLLPPMLRGEHVWCQLFSEPGAGSDLGSVTTRAHGDDDDWVVSGQKVWNTGAQFADMGMLIARTGESDSRHKGLTMFVVDMSSQGVSVRPIRQITGIAEFNEVFLDEVRIPHRNVVGEVNGGWAAVLAMLANERVTLASSGGTDNVELDSVVDVARSSGAAQNPEFRQRFARLYSRTVAIAVLGERLKESLRADDPVPGPEGSIGKLLVSQVARERADLMLEAAGPNGVAWSPEDPRQGRWAYELLAAPAVALGGGTDQIQRNVLAERILGMAREPAVQGRVSREAGRSA